MTSKRLTNGLSYGWANMHPETLAARLSCAVKKFGAIQKDLNIDAIAFTGSSGAAIAFPLALKYKLPLIYIRKPKEKSHGNMLECNVTSRIKRYIIVDDFTESGNTIRRIVAKVRKAARKFKWEGPECVGVYVFDVGMQGIDKILIDEETILDIIVAYG